MVDQNSQFFAILTNVGAAKQANADALGIAWKITQMAVGDANGSDPTPNPTQKSLINEWRRAPLNQLKVDDNDASIIVAEQVIPADIGGKWIREIGLYDADGDLVAVANCAPTYKPVLSQGSGRTQVLRMSLVVSNAANVQLKIDPSVVLATREWVTEELARQDFKHSVVAATTANITLSGLQAIDGVALTAGMRVLVKNQTAGKDNGLYTVVSGSAWTRCDDANSSAKVTPGLLVLVERGTANSDSAWQLVTDAPITLGVTALSFEMAFGRTGATAGTYRSVQVDKYGRVVAASNPTTVAGYGITDVYTKTETFTKAETTSAIATAVANAVAGLVDSSPGALDTLKELATAIGNDPNFATTMVNELAKKAPLASPVLTGDPRAPTPAVGDNDTSLATTAFVQAAMAVFGIGASTAQLVTDLNSATVGGFWRAAGGAANSVGTGAVNGVTFPYNGTGCLQVLSQFTAGGSPLHWRAQVAGVWSDWSPFAGLISPVFTGDPKAPTPALGDNDTSIATTEFVQATLKAFGAGVPNMPYIADVDDPTLVNGWFAVASTTLGIKPAGHTFGVLSVNGRNNVNATTGRINQVFYATDSQVWAAWGRVWKSGVGGWSDWSSIATLNSPAFTGTPTAPTALVGTNTTQIATMAALLQGINAFKRSYTGNVVGVGANLTLAAAQTGYAFNVTAAVTITLPAAADAGSGGTYVIRNVSSGNVTISYPSGSLYEKNTAASSAFLSPGEWVELQASTSAYFINKRGSLGEINKMIADAMAAVGVGTDRAPLCADVDAQTSSGFFYLNVGTSANMPYANNGFLLQFPWNGTSAALQIYVAASVDKLMYRAKSSGAWRAWKDLPSLDGVISAINNVSRSFRTQSIIGISANLSLNTTSHLGAMFRFNANSLTVTLPASVDVANGSVVTLHNPRAATQTLSVSAGGFVEEGVTGTQMTLQAYEWVELMSSDSNWFVSARGKLRESATVEFVQGGFAPLASPALTGAPTVPTAAAATNTTQAASTAFVQTAVASKAPLTSPALTGTPTVPTAAAATNTTQAASTAFVQTAVVNAIASATPPGMVAHFALSTPPAGWLKRNGAAYSRTTYAALFAVIGTTFGAGDGSTTFNVPDDRELFDRAWTDGLNSADSGRALFSTQSSQNAAHGHTASSSAAGAHSHTTTVPRERVDAVKLDVGGNAVLGDEQTDGPTYLDSSSAPNHTHTITINQSGGTDARPSNRAYLACIKY